MRCERADVCRYLLVVVAMLALPTLGGAADDDKTQPRRCDAYDLGREQCGKNERCHVNDGGDQHLALCECQRDFHLVNGECVRVAPTAVTVDPTTDPKTESESDTGGGSSVAAGLLIPTFLVVVGVLLYFGARRYKWLQRFRQYRHNRYGNVLVTRDDDDDDDPPIA